MILPREKAIIKKIKQTKMYSKYSLRRVYKKL